MLIKNQTRNTIIAKNPVWLSTFFGHARGLMLKPSITPHVLAFKSECHTSIHTCFVAGPIDIIFVSKNNRICELKKQLFPFSFYAPEHPAKYIIELPEKTIVKTRSRVGDVIRVHSTHHT